MRFGISLSRKERNAKADTRGIRLSFPPQIGPAVRLALILGFGIWTASGCSGFVLAPSSAAETDSPRIEAGSAVPSSSVPTHSPVPSTPTVEAAGVYPPPGSSTEGTAAQPKAVTPSEGGSSIFLPVIANEQAPLYPFELQTSGVIAMQGFYGCSWSGVAGILFGLDDIPIDNLILHLEGTWGGSPVNREVLSGTASQYNPTGAYEFILGTQTLDSVHTLWVQIRDSTGKEISPRISFDTYNDCRLNLIWISFNQVR